MATIKSYTSLEQSKKLAEILPIESADMHFTNSSIKGEMYVDQFKAVCSSYSRVKDFFDAYAKIVNNEIVWEVVPCWSLAALLEQLPYEVVDDEGGSRYLSMNKEEDMYQLIYSDRYEDYDSIETDSYENFVDACYEMILKLNELKML